MEQPRYQPSMQEKISSQIPLELPLTRSGSQKEILDQPEIGQLTTIKKLYDSWLPEDHHGVNFYQAICICFHKSETSHLVKKDPNKLKDIKDAVFQILNDKKLTLPMLVNYRYINGYDYDILASFDNNPCLTKNILKRIFEGNKGPENHQIRSLHEFL
jgi:hypothetical protein